MTDDRLKEIEALVEAATPGPWETDSNETGVPCILIGGEPWWPPWAYLTIPNHERKATISFIARSREIVPELLAEVRRLRATLRELKEQL